MVNFKKILGTFVELNEDENKSGGEAKPAGRLIPKATLKKAPENLQFQEAPLIDVKVNENGILGHDGRQESAVGDDIISRTCDNFSIRWMKSVGSRGWTIRSLSLSADGRWLAALVIESNFNLKDRRARVVILDAGTGAEKSMFPVRSFDLVALSADGATAAVAVRSRTKNTVEEYSLDIEIHATADGRLVSRLVHDVVSHAQDAMATYIGQRMLQFTSDGQYLLTTGRKTKLWKAPGA